MLIAPSEEASDVMSRRKLLLGIVVTRESFFYNSWAHFTNFKVFYHSVYVNYIFTTEEFTSAFHCFSLLHSFIKFPYKSFRFSFATHFFFNYS